MGSRSQESQNLFWQDSRGEGGNNPSFKNPMNFRNGEAEFWTEQNKKWWPVTGTPDSSKPKTKCDDSASLCWQVFCANPGRPRARNFLIGCPDLYICGLSRETRHEAINYSNRFQKSHKCSLGNIYVTDHCELQKRIKWNYVQPNWRHLEPAHAKVCFQKDDTQPLKRYESFIGFWKIGKTKCDKCYHRIWANPWDVPITIRYFKIFYIGVYFVCAGRAHHGSGFFISRSLWVGFNIRGIEYIILKVIT